MFHTFLKFGFSLALCICASPLLARDFIWDDDADVIGESKTLTAQQKDTLADLGEAHNVGYTEMLQANPAIDPWLPGEGSEILIPSRYLLPSIREGVVVNLREYRLYFFPKEGGKVISYPVGIGAAETPSPIIETQVKLKIEQPNWYPPESVRQTYFDEHGEQMARVVAPGPENPLGPFAIQLDLPDYFIHGTNKAFGVGTKVSHGCIRLYNNDISGFVFRLPKKTPVRIIKEPVKVGLIANEIFAEIHLDESDRMSDEDIYALIFSKAEDLARKRGKITLGRRSVKAAISKPLGIPQRIGILRSAP